MGVGIEVLVMVTWVWVWLLLVTWVWSSDGVEVAVLLVSLLPISNVHLGGGG